MQKEDLRVIVGDPLIEPSTPKRRPVQRDLLGILFARVHGLPVTHAATAMSPPSLPEPIVASSPTWQLELALRVLGVGVGDEVIAPGLSTLSVADAVLEAGAVPVLIDVDPATATLDPARCEAYLDGCRAGGKPLPKAIVPLHLHQCAANVDRFVDLCGRFGILLIEECAHVLGGEWNGRLLGTFGAMGVFSQDAAESGFMVTGVPALEHRLAAMMGHIPYYQTPSSVVWPDEVDELTAYWRARVDELPLGAWESDPGHPHRISLSSATHLAEDLDRLPGLRAERAAVLARLDGSLREVAGVDPLVVPAEVTSPLTRRFAFRFDPGEFAGMSGELFRKALSYLLGTDGISAPYCPTALARLGRAVPEKGLDGIDEFDLPVSERLFEQLVVIRDTWLVHVLRRPDLPDVMVQALTRMRDNAGQIVAAAT